MLGYFKLNITSEEKAELLLEAENYYNEISPIIVPLTLIKHYTMKYDEKYLKDQYYLNPHFLFDSITASTIVIKNRIQIKELLKSNKKYAQIGKNTIIPVTVAPTAHATPLIVPKAIIDKIKYAAPAI